MYINKSFIPAVAVSDQKMIIDGHHRVEMCKKNGISIDKHFLVFSTTLCIELNDLFSFFISQSKFQ